MVLTLRLHEATVGILAACHVNHPQALGGGGLSTSKLTHLGHWAASQYGHQLSSEQPKQEQELWLQTKA